MTEQERIRRALTPLHASEHTLEEVFKMAARQKQNVTGYKKHAGRRTVRTVLIAAAAAAALTVTAYAVGAYTGFFETVFGNGSIESRDGEHVRLTDEDGDVWKEYDLPAEERVAVDPDQAQELVGGETVSVRKSVKVQDVTFTVEDFIIDVNGIGALTYTMEDPNGFPGLTRFDGGGFQFEDPEAAGSQRVARLTLTAADGEEVAFLDSTDLMSADGTDTRKTVVSYFAPMESIDGAENLTVTFSVVKEHDPDAELYTDVVDEGSVSFSLSDAVAVTALTGPDGWSASVSPVGLVITPPEGNPYGSSYDFEDLVIHMADGTDYAVRQSDPYTYNITVGCYDADNEMLQVFNRIIDPAQVESVTAVGRGSGYQDATGQPVPYQEGLTEMNADLDLTFTK